MPPVLAEISDDRHRFADARSRPTPVPPQRHPPRVKDDRLNGSVSSLSLEVDPAGRVGQGGERGQEERPIEFVDSSRMRAAVLTPTPGLENQVRGQVGAGSSIHRLLLPRVSLSENGFQVGGETGRDGVGGSGAWNDHGLLVFRRSASARPVWRVRGGDRGGLASSGHADAGVWVADAVEGEGGFGDRSSSNPDRHTRSAEPREPRVLAQCRGAFGGSPNVTNWDAMA